MLKRRAKKLVLPLIAIGLMTTMMYIGAEKPQPTVQQR
jgi:hypothetical protein